VAEVAEMKREKRQQGVSEAAEAKIEKRQ